MEILFKCVELVNFNGADMILLHAEPADGRSHLMGKVLRDLGQIKKGKTYALVEVPD